MSLRKAPQLQALALIQGSNHDFNMTREKEVVALANQTRQATEYSP
jgi:hypothetical protein